MNIFSYFDKIVHQCTAPIRNAASTMNVTDAPSAPPSYQLTPTPPPPLVFLDAILPFQG